MYFKLLDLCATRCCFVKRPSVSGKTCITCGRNTMISVGDESTYFGLRAEDFHVPLRFSPHPT